MRRILTYLLSSVALPLQLLAVAYSTDRCSLPLSTSASGDSPVAVNPAANVAVTISWTRDGHLREFNQMGGPQCSNSVIRSGNSIASALESFGGPDITATTVTNFFNADGRLREIAVEVDGFNAMDLRSFAGYDSLGQLTSVTGQYFNASFASQDGGRITNTLVSVTNTVNLERNVIWSASGKPSRIDYTLIGSFLRRWQYTFQSNRVSRVFRSGGDSLKTEYAYNDKGYLVDAATSILTTGGSVSLPTLTYHYEYTAGGDTAISGVSGTTTRDELYPASDDLQRQRRWSPYLNIAGRVSDSQASVKIAHNGVTNTATVVGNFFYANPIIQNPAAATPTNGVISVIATPSGGGATDSAHLEFSQPVYSETPVFNNRGMIICDSRRIYVWDAAGRLKAITNNGVSPAVLTEFTYYADNRRATKKVSKFIGSAWQHQKTLQFVWDGWKLIAEIEKNPAGTITAVRQFIYGPDIQGQVNASLDSEAEGIGGLIMICEWTQATGENLYLPLTDGLGNICGLIDGTTGNLVAEYEYDPYGTLIMEQGPAIASCPFRHRTRYYDDENWLYYYGYRYYDSSTTKWISKDPLGEAGGWNLTAFCDNDPINNYDPTGLDAYMFGGTWVNDVDPTSDFYAESSIAELRSLYAGTVNYQPGAGTGKGIDPVAGGAFGAGGQARLDAMFEDLVRSYNTPSASGERQQIDIYGFSRGAALARAFANMIHERGIPLNGGGHVQGKDVSIRFLGTFDTVASFGWPGNDINPGKKFELPRTVASAAHAISRHEVRGKFPVTLFADNPRVSQAYFAGVHSNIGGAYHTGKAQGYVPLYWMWLQSSEAGVPLGDFPQDKYSALMRYRMRHNLNWNQLWSDKPEDIRVEPYHDSATGVLYFGDRVKRWFRGVFGGDRYKRKKYVH